MYQSKLPADPISLILGIVSLVIIFLGCCCGFVGVIALSLSITGLVMANKSLSEFDQNPEAYSYQTKSNVTSGRIVCIISTVVSSIFVLVMLAGLLFYGKLFSDVLKETYYNKQTNEYAVEDTIDSYEEDFEIDSLAVDTIHIYTINKK